MSGKENTGKILYLLRHGIALSTNTDGDKARTLAPKGKDDVVALGKIMKDKGYTPDHALCSPASRTKQTLDGLCASLTIDHIQYPENMYNGSAGDLLHHIQNIDDNENAALLVAHIPGIQELARLLTGSGPSSLVQRLNTGFSPGMMAVISCACENWKDIRPGENELTDILDPQDYNAPARPTRWM